MVYGRSEPLYDNIGIGYDATRRPDPYIASRLARHLRLRSGSPYLDIACGTGNYTVALAERGGAWHGLELSGQMVRTARNKGPAIAWFMGDAAALPFQDGSFAGALCTLAIHHFSALTPIFSEVYRVLARGMFVILTSTPEQMRGYWLNDYFPQAMARSIEQMPSLDLVQSSLSQAGFRVAYTEAYEIRRDLQDFFLYSGKHQPGMYLSPAVRQGISTFSSLADPGEVASGCSRLRADIASGKIDKIMEQYRHEEGDYLLVVSSKGL